MKKDTGYNKKTITHILERSTVILKYSNELKEYVTIIEDTSLDRRKSKWTPSSWAIFNKAKIIVNENESNKDELDDYQKIMGDFNNLGKELHDMINSFKTLRNPASST